MPGKTAKRSRTGGRGWGSGNEVKGKESWKKGRWETVEHSICRRARYVGRNGWGEGGEVSEDHEWQEREGKVRLIGGGEMFITMAPSPLQSHLQPCLPLGWFQSVQAVSGQKHLDAPGLYFHLIG